MDIRRVRLIEPDLLLEKDAQGKGNWIFETPRRGALPSSRDSGARPHSVFIHDGRVDRGSLTYRDGRSGQARNAALERLDLQHAPERTNMRAQAVVNGQGAKVTGELDRRGAAPAMTLRLDADGVGITASGGLPHTDVGTVVELTIREWSTLARLAGVAAPALPPLEATARISAQSAAWVLDRLKGTLGRSSFTGSVRIGASAAPGIDVRLDSPHLDLAELMGAARKTPSDGGRLFPPDPLPVAALQSVHDTLEARVARLTLRDGRTIDGVDLMATAGGGRIGVAPLRLTVAGRDLRVRADLDSTSGRTLGVTLDVDGRGIPLGALGALVNVSGTSEGSATDITIRFSGRGDSVRSLMAGSNADVRVAVGPGRLRNRVIAWDAEVAQLLDVINPGRRTATYSTLHCLVVRLPVRNGVARIDNSVAAETGMTHVVVCGTIDLREEHLDLGFRTRAVKGLGLEGLAGLVRLRGPLAAPKISLDAAGAARAATRMDLATLGAGLVAQTMAEHPCQAALGVPTDTAQRQTPQPAGPADRVEGSVRKIFDR